MGNLYATLAEIRTALEIESGDTSNDSFFLAILETASREIDRFCNRHFFVKKATKTFNPPGGGNLLIPDLLAVDSVAFDTDQDGDYSDETWTEGTQYSLWPLNHFPKTELAKIPWASAVFPANERSIQITGNWGFGDGESANPTKAISETWTLAAAGTTTVAVADGSDYSAGETYLVESEQIFIESISTNTLTVERGMNGTTAVDHASKTPSRFLYPRGVKQYTLELASVFFNEREDTTKQSERMGDYSFSRFPNAAGRAKMVLGSFRRFPIRGAL